jgi:hypothetical protein
MLIRIYKEQVDEEGLSNLASLVMLSFLSYTFHSSACFVRFARFDTLINTGVSTSSHIWGQHLGARAARKRILRAYGGLLATFSRIFPCEPNAKLRSFLL